MSEYKVIGTCGKCGGNVVKVFHGYLVGEQPKPKCEDCGATPEMYKPPIMKMAD